jgi:hypothetical protein
VKANTSAIGICCSGLERDTGDGSRPLASTGVFHGFPRCDDRVRHARVAEIPLDLVLTVHDWHTGRAVSAGDRQVDQMAHSGDPGGVNDVATVAEIADRAGCVRGTGSHQSIGPARGHLQARYLIEVHSHDLRPALPQLLCSRRSRLTGSRQHPMAAIKQ